MPYGAIDEIHCALSTIERLRCSINVEAVLQLPGRLSQTGEGSLILTTPAA